MICPLFPEPSYLIIAEGVSPLIYYSHLSSILITLVIVFFVFLSNWRSTINRLLFFLGLTYVLLTFGLLITWTNNLTSLILVAWSLYGILYTAICIQFYYLNYYFRHKQFPAFKKNLFFTALFIPAIVITPTSFNLPGFDLIDCSAIEDISFIYYYHAVAIITLIIILIEWFFEYKHNPNKVESKMNNFFTRGVIIFLIFFFTNSFLASYLVNLGYMSDYVIEQYALFGMTFFMVLIGYLIVRFQAFEIKLIAAQGYIAGLVITVICNFFFAESTAALLLNSLSLVLVLIGGFFTIRSVKREITQNVKLAELAKNLEQANQRLQFLDKQKSEFVSIASHQLSSPLAAIKGYTAMFLEGSYGQLEEKMHEPMTRIFESAKLMAMSIDDFLNVSRIESGNMKYEYSEFSIAEQASSIVDDLRSEAIKSGLILTYKSDISSQGVVKADIGKTHQILHNLINNSIKYTPQGTITVFVHEHIQNKKLYIEIIDTGIGMTKETLGELFGKFARAKNANSVNIKGTGLGLFVARQMARAMGGDVSAHSDGEGKGSHFLLILPLIR